MAWQTWMNRSSRSRVESFVLVAVLGDLHPADQFHDEVRPARFRRAGIEHLRDVRMVHHRQRLPLGFEARDDGFGVHAELDDLERDAAAHRFLLLGHVNDAAAAFADLLEQLVAADRSPGFFERLTAKRWLVPPPLDRQANPESHTGSFRTLSAETRCAGEAPHRRHRLLEVRCALLGWQFHRRVKDGGFPLVRFAHGTNCSAFTR